MIGEVASPGIFACAFPALIVLQLMRLQECMYEHEHVNVGDLKRRTVPPGSGHHPDLDAGLLEVAFRVSSTKLPDSADCRVEQHDVNIVMELRILAGTVSFERPALHRMREAACISQRGPRTA